MSETLKNFIEDLRGEKHFPNDETSVKQYIVLRALSIMDWDIFNLKEVIPEYSIGGKRVDYCLKNNNVPRVFIEVKNINESLDNPKHQEQLLDYAFRHGVKLAILTNGKTWEFYLALNEGSWEQRKFFTIDVMHQEIDEVIKNFSSFLLKENVVSEKTLKTAESYLNNRLKQKIIDSSLSKAWNKLISEPDELLIELVNESLEGISGVKAKNEKIAEFIKGNESKFLITEFKTSHTDLESLKTARKKPNNTNYARKGYTCKKIISFIFNGKTYYIGSWVGFLIKISEVIYDKNAESFSKVETLRGRKRKYFSTNKNEVVQPGRIGNTDYYVDTNLGSNMIVKVIYNVMNLFGYKRDSLKINCNDN